MVAVKRSKITFTDENNNPTAWNADVFVWSYNPESGKIENWDINGSDEGEGRLWAMLGGVYPGFPVNRIFKNDAGKGLILYTFYHNETGEDGFSFYEKLCTIDDDGSYKPVINSSAALAHLDYVDPAEYSISDASVTYDDFKKKTDEMLASYNTVLMTGYDDISSYRGTDPEPPSVSSDKLRNVQSLSEQSYTAYDAIVFLKTALGLETTGTKQDVPLDTLPDKEALQKFLDNSSQIKKYDSETGEFESDYWEDLFDSMLHCFGTITIPGDWHSLNSQTTDGGWCKYFDDMTDPRGWWPPENGERYGYYKCDADKVEWMAKNIAHADPGKLSARLDVLEQKQAAYKDKGDDGKEYYYFPMVFGGEYGGRITKAEYDGQYYYITFDEYTYYGDETEYTLYAVMGYETIDGQNYWTLYKQSLSSDVDVQDDTNEANNASGQFETVHGSSFVIPSGFENVSPDKSAVNYVYSFQNPALHMKIFITDTMQSNIPMTIDEEFQSYKDYLSSGEGNELVYEFRKDDVYVVSGYINSGNTVVYRKTRFFNDRYVQIEFEYSVGCKDECDKVLTTFLESFEYGE